MELTNPRLSLNSCCRREDAPCPRQAARTSRAKVSLSLMPGMWKPKAKYLSLTSFCITRGRKAPWAGSLGLFLGGRGRAGETKSFFSCDNNCGVVKSPTATKIMFFGHYHLL